MSTATTEQGRTAYDQTQSGLAQQQAFANAVGAQNGLGHQTDVYNQLQGVAAGTGPNPAQAALNQATGANVANQAALMAGQRGTGANAGLLARQAAMQGGALQQQAAGQGATMQAQQSLNAIGQAGALANQQAQQQAGAIQNYNAAAQGQQSNVLGALGRENDANVAMQSNINNANASIAQQNAKSSNSAAGGVLNSVAGALSGGLFAHGGPVQVFVDGGMAMPAIQAPALGPRSNVAANLGATKPKADVLGIASDAPEYQAGAGIGGLAGKGIAAGVNAIGNMFAPGAGAPMAAPTGVNGGPAQMMMAVAKGGAIDGEQMGTKRVPGKASVKGDSLKNDKVPAILSPGEVVLPRSVMNAKDPVAEAAKFVSAIMAKSNLKKK